MGKSVNILDGLNEKKKQGINVSKADEKKDKIKRITKTYGLSKRTIEAINVIAYKTKKKKGEIIEEAIDKLLNSELKKELDKRLNK